MPVLDIAGKYDKTLKEAKLLPKQPQVLANLPNCWPDAQM